MRNVLTFLVILFALTCKSQTEIDPLFFGQNYWYTEPDSSKDFDAVAWNKILQSGVKTMRYGGTSANKGTQRTSVGAIRFVCDAITSHSLLPVFQIPFNGEFKNSRKQYLKQKELVKQLVTEIAIHKNLKGAYYCISNEPDHDFRYNINSNFDLDKIVTYVRDFSTIIKDIDSSAMIIAPETAWFNYPAFQYLFSNDRLEGKITEGKGRGKAYVDIVSFHDYPVFTNGNRGAIIGYPDGSCDYSDRNFDQILSQLESINGLKDKRIAVDEFNFTNEKYNKRKFNRDPDLGADSRSFIAGQYIANMLCVGLKHHLKFMNLRSVKEGIETLGYLNDDNSEKWTYKHFKLVANHFRGSFLPLKIESAVCDVKVFACLNGDKVTVLILNEHENNKRSDINSDPSYKKITLRFDGTVPASGDVKVAVNANGTGAADIDVLDESTRLITFDRNTGERVSEIYFGLFKVKTVK